MNCTSPLILRATRNTTRKLARRVSARLGITSSQGPAGGLNSGRVDSRTGGTKTVVF